MKRKRPTLLIATLALGIGANTAVFSVLNAVLLQPLPYRDSGRLVAIWDREIYAKGTSKLFDLYTDYENWKAHARSFTGVAGVTWAGAGLGKILKGSGPTRTVLVLPATADFFSLLGVAPQLGRTFAEGDVGRGCSVVVTDTFWRNSLGGNPKAVGQTVRLSDEACTVLGVMPAGFAFLPPEAPVEMWSLMARPAKPDEVAMAVFARLAPGAAAATAQAEVTALHRRIHENDRWGAQMEPVVYDLHGEFTWLTGRNLQLSLWALFGAVGFVLLICCVNAANLLLGRGVARQREMAIRAALGAGRARLLWQLLAESLAMSGVAAVIGALLAAAAVDWFRTARPIGLPPGVEVSISPAVLLFTAMLSVITACLFGVVPAWKVSQVDLHEALKTGGRTATGGRHRFGKALIVAEVALTVVLLAGAGMLIQTVRRFAVVPLGINVEGLVMASLRLPATGYGDGARRARFFDRLTEELSAIPGVNAAALSTAQPIGGGGSMDVMEVEGHESPRPESRMDTHIQMVTPEYFRVLNTPLKQGRAFGPADREGAEPVAIVNEALARRYFGAESAIGRHVRPFAGGKGKGGWLRVVGVVGDEKRSTVYQEMAWVDPPILYRPVAQEPPAGAILILRAPVAVGEALRRRVAALDPDVPVDDVRPVREIAAKVLAYPQFRAAMLAGFAGLALVLAAVGLSGVLGHVVSQRTQEIGIRMALGAQPESVMRMVMREGLVPVAGGVVIGVGASLALGRYLAALLYEVKGVNAGVMAAVLTVLLAAAAGAMWAPARRASRVDPLIALKWE